MALAWPRDLIGRRVQGEQRRGAQDGLKLPVFGDVAVLARLGVVADTENVTEQDFQEVAALDLAAVPLHAAFVGFCGVHGAVGFAALATACSGVE